MNEFDQMLHDKNITVTKINNHVTNYTRIKHFPITDKYRLLRNGLIIKTDICHKFSDDEGVFEYSVMTDRNNKIIEISVKGKHKNIMLNNTYCNDLVEYAVNHKLLISKQFIEELEDNFETEYIY